MKRREFTAGLGSAATWSLAARAQQPAVPVVGFVNAGAAANTSFLAAFRAGLRELGYVEGQNVSVEYYVLEGRFDRIPALMAELVRRHPAVIVTAGTVAGARAAKQQRRRSRSCSALMTIRSGLASSRVLHGRAAI